MRGEILVDLEESWLVVKDRAGPRQFWSCSKQSWCYGDLSLSFLFVQDNRSVRLIRIVIVHIIVAFRR